MSKQAKGYSYLLLTAMIWGCAFVAQSVGMQYIGPFTFQAVRCALGACTLIPYLLVSKKVDTQSRMEPIPVKSQILGGVLCGAALFAATNLQQFGLLYTTVSKSGFISALYILIVPIWGVFLHKNSILSLDLHPFCLCRTVFAEYGGRPWFSISWRRSHPYERHLFCHTYFNRRCILQQS